MELPESIQNLFGGDNTKAMLATSGLLLIILGLAAYFLFFSAPTESSLTVKVTNDSGQGMWMAKVSLSAAGQGENADSGNKLSVTTGRDGIAVFGGFQLARK
ncbi:Uncharacterised protein [uncultured archaeon]|nr:Uncharacterised protein [uncultured archaeon]